MSPYAVPLERENNLFGPVEEDLGSRGRLGERTRPDVPAISGTAARGVLAAAAACLAAGALAAAWRLGAGRGPSRREERIAAPAPPVRR